MNQPAAPVLHYHPLSSYCQKVLIAADALGVALDKRLLNLGDAAERAAYLALWPTGKMPLLVDGGRPVAESSIIIEHLQRHHAAPGHALIPDAVDAALDVRLLAHPAVARAIDDARPFFQYYPGRAGLAARFLPAGA